jgi:hypothetical protein
VKRSLWKASSRSIRARSTFSDIDQLLEPGAGGLGALQTRHAALHGDSQPP